MLQSHPSHLPGIVSRCLHLEYFPKARKFGIAVKLPKPGKNSETPHGYGPITLLSKLGKVFERCIEQTYHRLNSVKKLTSCTFPGEAHEGIEGIFGRSYPNRHQRGFWQYPLERSNWEDGNVSFASLPPSYSIQLCRRHSDDSRAAGISDSAKGSFS